MAISFPQGRGTLCQQSLNSHYMCPKVVPKFLPKLSPKFFEVVQELSLSCVKFISKMCKSCKNWVTVLAKFCQGCFKVYQSWLNFLGCAPIKNIWLWTYSASNLTLSECIRVYVHIWLQIYPNLNCTWEKNLNGQPFIQSNGYSLSECCSAYMGPK